MKNSKRILSVLLALCLMGGSFYIPSQSVKSVNAGEVVLTGKPKTVKYANTPYGKHGKLKIKGSKVVDKNGKTFILKGVSSHGINWDVGYPFVNEKALQNLRDEWGVNCFRVAMYTEEYNGYCITDKESKKQLLDTVDVAVKAAKRLGIYVVIDWHILSDGNPNTHKKAAKTFFTKMSKKYKDYGNVIYEICNEPNGVSWKSVKSYANYIIPVIRQNTNNIIIVGTPNWCQDVDVVAKSKIKGYKNIAYAFHFYAATHKDDYRKKVKSACKRNLPIICTEFSACEASGNGKQDFESLNEWIKLFNKKKIGYMCWSLSNKDESASLLKPSTKKTSGFTTKNVTKIAKWLIKTNRNL